MGGYVDTMNRLRKCGRIGLRSEYPDIKFCQIEGRRSDIFLS